MTEAKLDGYKRLSTEFYDLDKPSAPPDKLEFYSDWCQRLGGPALEAMCGGRFLIPLLERGADIHGVDASAEMLNLCRTKAEERGIAAHLYAQFVQQLDLPRQFAFIFIPDGSFSLIPAQEAANSLERLRDHLLPNGTFMIELFAPMGDRERSENGRPRKDHKAVHRRVPNGWERVVARPDGTEIALRVLPDGGQLLHAFD